MSFDWNAFAAESPAAILAVQGDGVVVYANRAACSLLGRELTALQGIDVGRLVGPAFAPPIGADWASYLASLIPRGATSARLTMLHQGGAALETDCIAVGGRDSAGRPLCILALTTRPADLADVHGDVAQVHRAIFENAPIGIFYFDPRGVITALNERFVHVIGSSQRHLVGLNLLTLQNEGVVGAIRRALAGESARWEGDYTSVTGARRASVRLIVEPIRDQTGTVVAGLGLVEEVTEQVRARELVERTERLASLGTFAAGLALDVEVPLALTLANVELATRLVEDLSTSVRSELAHALETARDGAVQVAQTVRDLKTIAREDVARRSPVAVPEVIAQTLEHLGPAATADVPIHVATSGAPAVFAVRPRLVQAFSALVLRAVESARLSKGEPRVDVRVGVDPDGRVRIEVEDSGPGLTDDHVSRLFEPFATDAGGPQGLGLAVAHGVVVSLGGEIFLDRSRPASSDGARFVILLPSADRPAEPASRRGLHAGQPAPASTPPTPVRARGKVLVVDDEERLAATLRLALSGEHDVDVATRGRRALELIRDHEYDVILCDLSLPDVSGIDVFEEAKKLKPSFGARFVFLTGGAFQARTRAFLQSVENARLDKPFDLDALERLIADRVASQFAKPS